MVCRTIAILFLCVFAWAPGALAQINETKTAPKAQPPAARKPDDAWQRIVYVPYRAIKSILEDPQATAIVPLQEYLRLLQTAGAAGIRTLHIPAVVTKSHYVGRVEQDVVRIQARLTVQSVQKNWSEATLTFGGAAIGKMTAQDNRVLMRGVSAGSYALLVPGAGSYTVDLELSTPVRTSPDGRSIEFDCPAAGITTFELTIPEADQAVEMVPQPVVQPTSSQKGATRIVANLPSTPHITARWRPRVGARPDMELLAGVENMLRVTVGDGIVHTDAAFAYKVFRGELGQLRLAVPLGDRILDVSSPQGAIRTWRAMNEANRQLVIVDLLSAASKESTIEVHTERPLPADGFDVAGIDDKGRVLGIHAVDVVRESGRLILSHSAGIDIAVEAEKGLVRVEAAEVPAAYRKADAVFYRFYSPAVSLRVSARPVEPQTVFFQRSQIVFTEDELRLTANVRCEVSRAGIFEIVFKIPEGLAVDAVESTAMRAFQVDSTGRKLVVTLNERRQGPIDLEIKGHRDAGAASEVELPLLEPVGGFRDDGIVEAFAPEGIELASDESKLTGAHPEPPGSTALLPNTHRAGTWSYHHRPVAIRVKMLRKPTRLTAQVGSTITVGQESIAVAARVEFTVENAGIDTFRIALPEGIAPKAQIQAEGDAIGVKQQSHDEKAIDGWVAWTIVLQQKVTGKHRFLVKYDLKPAASPKEPGTAEVAVPLPQALGLKNPDGTDRVALTRISGEVAVLKDRSLSVTATASADVEPIDGRELKQLAQTADLAYRYEKQPVELKLTLVKHAVQEVVETVVSRALAEVVVGRDASAAYRCRYLVRSSQRQRLALDLPGEANVLGVFVDGKQVALETNPSAAKSERWSGYFVNIVRARPSDEALLLTVQFRQPLDPATFEPLGGRLKLVFPKIGGPVADRVVVQQSRAAIWVPAKYALVQTPDGFIAEPGTWRPTGLLAVAADGPNPSELDNWIGIRGGLLEFPHEGNGYAYNRLGPADSIVATWVNLPIYTVIISLAIAVVAWLLRRSRWETLATLVLTAIVAATLVALVDRELVWHFLLAARYGLLALAAIWLIEVFHRRSAPHSGGVRGPSSTATIPPGVVVPPPGVSESLQAKEDRT